MAFPSVLQTSTFQKDDANATSFEVDHPSGLTNDNTLIVIFCCDGGTDIVMTADGLTQLGPAGNGTVTIKAAWRKIDGTEPTTFTITTGTTQRACAVVYEIQGAADPTVSAPISALSNGDSINPDPPNHDPSTEGTEDFLWIAAIGVDRDESIDSFPSNMDTGNVELSVQGGGANSCSIGATTHQFRGSSFNPNTFTISSGEGYGGLTIDIVPDATGLLSATAVTLPLVVGDATITSHNLSATAITLPVLVGDATITAGPVSLSATAITLPVLVGDADVTPTVSLAATAITLPVLVGDADVTPTVSIAATAITLPVVVGDATITSHSLSATAIALPIVVGDATITSQQFMKITGNVKFSGNISLQQ